MQAFSRDLTRTLSKVIAFADDGDRILPMRSEIDRSAFGLRGLDPADPAAAEVSAAATPFHCIFFAPREV